MVLKKMEEPDIDEIEFDFPLDGKPVKGLVVEGILKNSKKAVMYCKKDGNKERCFLFDSRTFPLMRDGKLVNDVDLESFEVRKKQFLQFLKENPELVDFIKKIKYKKSTGYFDSLM